MYRRRKTHDSICVKPCFSLFPHRENVQQPQVTNGFLYLHLTTPPPQAAPRNNVPHSSIYSPLVYFFVLAAIYLCCCRRPPHTLRKPNITHSKLSCQSTRKNRSKTPPPHLIVVNKRRFTLVSMISNDHRHPHQQGERKSIRAREIFHALLSQSRGRSEGMGNQRRFATMPTCLTCPPSAAIIITVIRFWKSWHFRNAYTSACRCHQPAETKVAPTIGK